MSAFCWDLNVRIYQASRLSESIQATYKVQSNTPSERWVVSHFLSATLPHERNVAQLIKLKNKSFHNDNL